MIPLTMELLTMVQSTQHRQANTVWRGTAHSHTLIHSTPFSAVHSQGTTIVVTQKGEAESRGAIPPTQQHAGSTATSLNVLQLPLPPLQLPLPPHQLAIWITS